MKKTIDMAIVSLIILTFLLIIGTSWMWGLKGGFHEHDYNDRFISIENYPSFHISSKETVTNKQKTCTKCGHTIYSKSSDLW